MVRDARGLRGGWAIFQRHWYGIPAADLTPYVTGYWAAEWDLRGQPPYRQKIVPYPNVQLTFRDGDPVVRGPERGHTIRTLEGRGWVFGVTFRPGAFRPLLGESISTITGRTLPAKTVFGPNLPSVPRQPAADPTPRTTDQTPDRPGPDPRPDVHGSRPDAHGSRPDAHGSRPVAGGSQLGAHGPQPVASGSRPNDHGSRPDTHGSQPVASGSQLGAYGSHQAASGSRSEGFQPDANASRLVGRGSGPPEHLPVGARDDDKLAAGPEALAVQAFEALARATAQRVEVFLRGRLPELDPQAAQAAAIVARIRAEPQLTRVDALARSAGLGVRRLQRLFAEHVGLGPKWVIRRYRLHEVGERLASGMDIDWVRLAVELGYADQAHFVRDFTAMIGEPPTRYAERYPLRGDRRH